MAPPPLNLTEPNTSGLGKTTHLGLGPGPHTQPRTRRAQGLTGLPVYNRCHVGAGTAPHSSFSLSVNTAGGGAPRGGPAFSGSLDPGELLSRSGVRAEERPHLGCQSETQVSAVNRTKTIELSHLAQENRRGRG